MPENKYKVIFDYSPEAILIISLTGKIIDVNNRIEEWLGYKKKDIIGKNILKVSFVSTAEKLKIGKEFAKTLQGKKKTPYNVEFKHKNGEIMTGRINSILIKDKNNKPLELIVIISNVTEDILSKEKIIKTNKRLENITSSMSDWNWEIDKNGKYTYVSDNIKNILGYTPKEVIGKSLFDFIDPEDIPRISKITKKAFKNKKRIVNLVNRNITKSGKKIYLLTNAIPILNKKGNLTGYQGIDKDITEEQEKENRYKVIFDNSLDALMTMKSPSWNFIAGNASAIALFNTETEKNFISTPPWKYSPKLQPNGKSSMSEAKKHIKFALEKGKHSFPWKHKKITGEEFDALVILVRNEYHGDVFLQATVRDITIDKKKREELETINRLMVGREIKMIKLKEKIIELEKKLSK